MAGQVSGGVDTDSDSNEEGGKGAETFGVDPDSTTPCRKENAPAEETQQNTDNTTDEDLSNQSTTKSVLEADLILSSSPIEAIYDEDSEDDNSDDENSADFGDCRFEEPEDGDAIRDLLLEPMTWEEDAICQSRLWSNLSNFFLDFHAKTWFGSEEFDRTVLDDQLRCITRYAVVDIVILLSWIVTEFTEHRQIDLDFTYQASIYSVVLAASATMIILAFFHIVNARFRENKGNILKDGTFTPEKAKDLKKRLEAAELNKIASDTGYHWKILYLPEIDSVFHPDYIPPNIPYFITSTKQFSTVQTILAYLRAITETTLQSYPNFEAARNLDIKTSSSTEQGESDAKNPSPRSSDDSNVVSSAKREQPVSTTSSVTEAGAPEDESRNSILFSLLIKNKNRDESSAQMPSSTLDLGETKYTKLQTEIQGNKHAEDKSSSILFDLLSKNKKEDESGGDSQQPSSNSEESYIDCIPDSQLVTPQSDQDSQPGKSPEHNQVSQPTIPQASQFDAPQPIPASLPDVPRPNQASLPDVPQPDQASLPDVPHPNQAVFPDVAPTNQALLPGVPHPGQASMPGTPRLVQASQLGTSSKSHQTPQTGISSGSDHSSLPGTSLRFEEVSQPSTSKSNPISQPKTSYPSREESVLYEWVYKALTFLEERAFPPQRDDSNVKRSQSRLYAYAKRSRTSSNSSANTVQSDPTQVKSTSVVTETSETSDREIFKIPQGDGCSAPSTPEKPKGKGKTSQSSKYQYTKGSSGSNSKLPTEETDHPVRQKPIKRTISKKYLDEDESAAGSDDVPAIEQPSPTKRLRTEGHKRSAHIIYSKRGLSSNSSGDEGKPDVESVLSELSEKTEHPSPTKRLKTELTEQPASSVRSEYGLRILGGLGSAHEAEPSPSNQEAPPSNGIFVIPDVGEMEHIIRKILADQSERPQMKENETPSEITLLLKMLDLVTELAARIKRVFSADGLRFKMAYAIEVIEIKEMLTICFEILRSAVYIVGAPTFPYKKAFITIVDQIQELLATLAPPTALAVFCEADKL